MVYRPMTLVDLAARMKANSNEKIRWKLVWEFLEEYRWETSDAQPALLRSEPESVGDERWDALLAALAEHLAAKHDLAPSMDGTAGVAPPLVPCRVGQSARGCAGLGSCSLPQARCLPFE